MINAFSGRPRPIPNTAHLKAVRSTPAMSIEDTSKDYFIIVHNFIMNTIISRF